MAGGTDLQGRLERVEEALAEADGLLQQRQRTLAGAGRPDFEDRLLLAVRDLAAVVRDLASQGGQASSTARAAPTPRAAAEAQDSPRRQAAAIRREEEP